MHKAHLICNVSGPIEKKMAAYQLTKVVAATCLLTPALGVYWGAAGLMHDPEPFVGMATEMTRDGLPLYLWLQFIVGRSQDGVGVRTIGMASLGFMEIEVVDSALPAKEVGGFVFNIAHFLLDHGPVLKDGDTIGLSAEQKILVRHLPSTVNESEKVYRLSC